MMKLEHRFVEFIPEKIEENILYISITYCTAIHKCVCGCGNEVVTPFSSKGWKLTFDGESVTLNPSIGNYNFACKSHYWIVNDEIKMVPSWSQDPVKDRRKKVKKKRKFYLPKWLF